MSVFGLAATCAYLELPAEVQELAKKTLSGDKVIADLVEEKQHLDALRLRAYLLPKRESVWWGCLCVRDELNGPLAPKQVAALDAAIAWVSDPCDESRREAERQANATGCDGPGGLLALSAFWTEGSIAPDDAPPVPADDRLTSRGVAAALITAAYHGDATLADQRLASFFEKGQEVADGKIPFPTPDA
jgi:hypothetical protein